MNRRSFIQSAGAFFAALATGGPRLLGQRPPQFTWGAPIPEGDTEGWTLVRGEQILQGPSGKAPRHYSIEWTDGVPVRSNPDYLIADHPIGAEFVTVYDAGDFDARRVERAPDGRSWAVAS